MIKLSDVLEDVIAGNPLLQFGLQNRLLNLSQTARYLQPLIEVRAKKCVKTSTIVMALSRLQRKISKNVKTREDFSITNINVHVGLCTYTFAGSHEANREIHKLHTALQKKNSYFTITQGIREIQVFFESEHASTLCQCVHAKPLFKHMHLAAVSIQFGEGYAETPGFFSTILQQLAFQGINVVEASSTFTEFVLYVHEDDIKVVFDTLYGLFSKEKKLAA